MFVPSVDAAPAPTISELLIKKLPFRRDVGAPVQRWPRCFLLEVRICSPPRNLELRRSPTTTTTVHLRGIPARKFSVVPGRDSGTDGREEDAFPQVG